MHGLASENIFSQSLPSFVFPKMFLPIFGYSEIRLRTFRYIRGPVTIFVHGLNKATGKDIGYNGVEFHLNFILYLPCL